MFNAKYDIYEIGSKGDSMICTVEGYESIISLKNDMAEVINSTCLAHKTPEGAKVLVKIAITDEAGKYVDSEEIGLVYSGSYDKSNDDQLTQGADIDDIADHYCMNICTDGKDDVCEKCHVRKMMDWMRQSQSTSARSNADPLFTRESYAAGYRNTPFGVKQIFRYSVDLNYGGIVIATDKKEGKCKVDARYKDHGNSPVEIIVWDVKKDDYFNERHSDVMECYGS